jgi:hypothetical protein
LVVHVEFQWPDLLARGVHADAGDLEQAQRIYPRDQTDWHGPTRSGVGWLGRPDDCLERRQRVEIAFAPRKDVSGPALAVAARGIGPEAHQLIGAHFKRKISDLKQLLRRCAGRKDAHERGMHHLTICRQ